MRTIRPIALVLTLALAATAVPARGEVPSANAALREEIVASFADAADKVVALAEAIPAEKYAWRPAEKVRSVSEVAMHVASANFYFSGLLGLPTDVATKDLEKETNKAKVVETLKKSVEHAKQAIRQASDAEWQRQRDFFGTTKSGQGVALLIASHAHEHLGQLIAYARSNKVTPPWSK